jgi:hypothetical protein
MLFGTILHARQKKKNTYNNKKELKIKKKE